MKENLRNYVILSGNHRTKLLLKVVNEKANLGFSDLGRELKHSKPKSLSGGTFWHTLKDARIMKIIENGYGFHLSELGKKFLNTFSQEINKEAHLNVPLFKKCYEELPNETNYEKVRNWFLPHLEDFDKKLRGTVIRRYLEGVYGVTVPKRPRVNIKQYKKFIKSDSVITPTIVSDNITYFDLLKNHNLSDEKITQILTIVSNISEEKQESALKLLCKEIKI